MREQLLEFLKYQTNKNKQKNTQQNIEYVTYLNSLYPNYPLPIQIKLFERQLPEPFCANCAGVLNNIKNQTCSTKCREELKNKTGSRQEILKKMQSSCIEKYGVANPMQFSEFQKKRITSNIFLYGSKVSDLTRKKARERSNELNIKGRITLHTKYGVNNPGQMDSHQEKSKNSSLQRFGASHFTQSDEFYIQQILKYTTKYKDFVSILSVHHDSFYSNKYQNANKRIEFQCNTCNTIETLPTETFKFRIRSFNTPCANCSNVGFNSSAKEKAIGTFLKDNQFSILENDRKIIHPYELDIVIPDHKIAIEFTGLFWHSKLDFDKNKHVDKMYLCKEQGYRLITIFEDEWDFKEEIVKARLLYILGNTSKTIYARNCIVQEIETTDATKFINAHHIQGYHGSNIKLGLYYNNELSSVMTFKKGNISKGLASNVWELHRFCSNQNVVGAAGKLFQYFLNTHKPTQVISYSDLRWNTGLVYEKIGMSLDSITKPNYWYVEKNKRIHRFGLRKNSKDDPNLTEWENRKNQGWRRIWDCGHAKYIWRKP